MLHCSRVRNASASSMKNKGMCRMLHALIHLLLIQTPANNQLMRQSVPSPNVRQIVFDEEPPATFDVGLISDFPIKFFLIFKSFPKLFNFSISLTNALSYRHSTKLPERLKIEIIIETPPPYHLIKAK